MTNEPLALDYISLLDYARPIKDALGDPLIDVAREADAGNIKLVTGTPVPGDSILISIAPNVFITINNQIRNRYQTYTDVLAVINAERAAGKNNLIHVLDALRTNAVAEAFSDKKTAAMSPVHMYGHMTVLRPYMGQYFRVRRDMCIPFHHFVLQRLLRERLSVDLDAVFEIGSGAGDSLAELALANPYPHIQFFGGEIARAGQKCLAAFADISGLSNLRGIEFDITAPDFSFMKGARRIMVYSHFALVYPSAFPDDFFDRLLDIAEGIECLIFEPLSFAFAKEFSIKPLFDEKRAHSYGISAHPWSCIRRLSQAGRIVIDEIIPDIVGKTLLSSVSLIRFRKLRQFAMSVYVERISGRGLASVVHTPYEVGYYLNAEKAEVARRFPEKSNVHLP